MEKDRLSPLSAAFLQIEDAEPEASLAIGSIAVFEGPPPTYDEMLATVAGRLALLPRYRQKVLRMPWDLAAPVWVDDPQFDLRWHVRHTAVPSPGGDAELGRLMSRVMTRRMDRSRPLWEYWLVEGLADGKWALISKLHHALADGVSGTDIYRLLLDPGPEPVPPVPDAWKPRSAPSTLGVLAHTCRQVLTSPAGAVRALGAVTRSPVQGARQALHAARGMLALSGAIRPAGVTSLVGPLDGSRRFAWTTTGFAEVRAIRTAFGGSVNDVALAVIAGGFRRLLIERGEVPSEHLLRTLLPVSVRAPGEERIQDNRVSLMLPYLPVEVADPVERLHVVQDRVGRLKELGEAEAGEALTSLAEVGPFAPLSVAVRLAFHLPQRWISTVTTNVPGPRAPLYAMGRRAEQLIPYVPIADRVRVGIAIFSYCDDLTFGITADYNSVPDIRVLARGIAASIDELVAAAAGVRAS